MRLPLLAAVAAAGLLVLASLAPVYTTNAQAKPDRLKSVLAQMDAGSAKFHSAEASIQKQQFEKIVNDTTTESGTIYFLRSGNSIQMGARFDPPNAQTLEYKNGPVTYLYSRHQPDQDLLSRRRTRRWPRPFLALGSVAAAATSSRTGSSPTRARSR